jgi:hypothetical protein
VVSSRQKSAVVVRGLRASDQPKTYLACGWKHLQCGHTREEHEAIMADMFRSHFPEDYAAIEQAIIDQEEET